MNGNWNGINSRYPEQIHQKVTNMYQDGTEPSMDVINTIVSILPAFKAVYRKIGNSPKRNYRDGRITYQ